MNTKPELINSLVRNSDKYARLVSNIKAHPSTIEHQAETHIGFHIWVGSTPDHIKPLICREFTHPFCGYCYRLNKDLKYAQDEAEHSANLLDAGELEGAFDSLREAIETLRPWGVPEKLEQALTLLNEIKTSLGNEPKFLSPTLLKKIEEYVRINFDDEYGLGNGVAVLIGRYAMRGWENAVNAINYMMCNKVH